MTKNALLFAASLLFASTPLLAAPVVLNATITTSTPLTIDVPAGKRFVLKALYPPINGNNPISLYYNSDGATDKLVFNYLTAYAERNTEWLIGPATVKFTYDNSGGAPYRNASIIYELLDMEGANVSVQSVASQIVVIPENATAGADVILESSTDLTNWTAALPGSYSPTTSNRFYRVRLVFR